MAGTVSAEDKLLLSRAYDALELAGRTGSPKFLGFLNEHESLFLRQHLPKSADVIFFGGYPGSVRLMMGASADTDSFPVTALEFCYREQDDLRHRDFLGSLMNLGIQGMIGRPVTVKTEGGMILPFWERSSVSS